MKPTFKIAAAFLFFTSLSFRLFSQDQLNQTSDSSRTENISITKKGALKEKVTVVIDGNNVTVNGKPVDEFKNDSIDITTQDMPDIADVELNVLRAQSLADQSRDYAQQYKDFGNQQMNMNLQLQKMQNQMHNHISSNKAFLGVMSEQTDNGAKITDVTKQSAAAKAGLVNGDIITEIDHQKVSGPEDLYALVGKHKPNDKISITYLHNGYQQTAQATLGKTQTEVYSWNAPGTFDLKRVNPDFSFNFNNDKPRLGLEAQDTEDGNGVKITDVDGDLPAGKSGLKDDDIITMVDGKKITSVDDLKSSMSNVKKGDIVKITYSRDNKTQTVDVKFPKDLKTIDL